MASRPLFKKALSSIKVIPSGRIILRKDFLPLNALDTTPFILPLNAHLPFLSESENVLFSFMNSTSIPEKAPS